MQALMGSIMVSGATAQTNCGLAMGVMQQGKVPSDMQMCDCYKNISEEEARKHMCKVSPLHEITLYEGWQMCQSLPAMCAELENSEKNGAFVIDIRDTETREKDGFY